MQYYPGTPDLPKKKVERHQVPACKIYIYVVPAVTHRLARRTRLNGTQQKSCPWGTAQMPAGVVEFQTPAACRPWQQASDVWKMLALS